MEDVLYKAMGLVITVVILVSLAKVGFQALGLSREAYPRDVAESVASIITEMASSPVEYKISVYEPPKDMAIRATSVMVEVNSTRDNTSWKVKLNIPNDIRVSGTVKNPSLVCIMKARKSITLSSVSTEEECRQQLEVARSSYYG